MRRYGFHHSQFAIGIFLLLVCFANHASAQSNGAALRAMERMRFAVKVGDSADVVVKLVGQELGKPSTTTLTMAYSVTGVDQPPGAPIPTGYRVTLAVKSMGIEGSPMPAGIDDVIRAMFPPVELRTNDKLDALEILNWAQVEQQRKEVERRLTSSNPRVALAVLLMTSMYSQKDQLLSLFAPIGEMQRKMWLSRNGGFDVTVTRRQGASTLGAAESQETVVMTGQRRLIPMQESNGKIRVTMQTSYETAQLEAWLRKSPIGQMLGKDVAWHMTMSSTGEAEYDMQTGWIERMSETFRMEMQHPRTKITPREETFELIQRRAPGPNASER